MLTYPMLKALERALRDERVLCVYLDGGVGDPAFRGAWQTNLDHALAAIEREIPEDDRDGRVAFSAAADQVRKLVPHTAAGALGSPGWLAVTSPSECIHAEVLPCRVRTSVTWRKGMPVAQYLRVLRASHHALVAIVDGRSARLYRCRAGEVRVIDRFHSHVDVAPRGHMGYPPADRMHHGVHGATGTDVAEHVLRAGRERMFELLAARIEDAVTSDEWVVVGGAPVAARAAADHIPPTLHDRLVFAPGVHRSATDHELHRTAQEAIAEVMREREHAQVKALVDAAGSRGLGLVGPVAVDQALALGAVRRVYLSETFVREHADDAEAAIRSAFDRDAQVELLEPPVSRVLDARGAGMAALLRFQPFAAQRAADAVPAPVAATSIGLMPKSPPAAGEAPLARS